MGSTMSVSAIEICHIRAFLVGKSGEDAKGLGKHELRIERGTNPESIYFGFLGQILNPSILVFWDKSMLFGFLRLLLTFST